MLSVNQGGGVDEFDNQLNDPGQYDNPQDPASLSVVEHLRALSVKGKLTLVYVLAVILLLVLWLDWVSPLPFARLWMFAAIKQCLGNNRIKASFAPRAALSRKFCVVFGAEIRCEQFPFVGENTPSR